MRARAAGAADAIYLFWLAQQFLRRAMNLSAVGHKSFANEQFLSAVRAQAGSSPASDPCSNFTAAVEHVEKLALLLSQDLILVTS